MPEHQTYTLTTILNTNHLQPDLYRHMIHEIKSPLQEQSFELTNDNSRSFEQGPRRPNIPPPPPKSPLLDLYNPNHFFSRTYESMSADFEHSAKRGPQPIRTEAIESVVSPLEYEINLKEQSFMGFCGGKSDSILQSQYQIEIEAPPKSQSLKRRPIFPKDQRQTSRKPLKSVEEAKTALLRVSEPELASFLELMGALDQDLKQIDLHKLEMEKDLTTIYQILSSQTQYAAQVSQVNDTHSRILRRLHSRNAGDVVAKVMGRRRTKEQTTGERHLETLFARLNHIENTISAFVQRELFLEHMVTVYDFFTQNFGEESTFLDQLRRLYDSLGVGVSTEGLSLIWEAGGERKLKLSEFIEGLSLNSLVVRSEEGYEGELYSKGFRRNGPSGNDSV